MAKASKNQAKDVETKKETKIDEMSLQELKALAYDIIVAIQHDQQVLNQVNEKIAKLSQIEKEKTVNFLEVVLEIIKMVLIMGTPLILLMWSIAKDGDG